MLTDWSANRALSRSLSPSVVSLTAQTYSKTCEKVMQPHNFTCTLSFCFWKLRVQPWFVFWQHSTLSSNATTDVLMLMLSLSFAVVVFSHSSFLVTERKPSRTVQATGGLCANMIRANKDCQTRNKERAKQEENHGKTKARKRSWMKRRIKGPRERIVHWIKGQAAAEVMDE